MEQQSPSPISEHEQSPYSGRQRLRLLPDFDLRSLRSRYPVNDNAAIRRTMLQKAAASDGSLPTVASNSGQA
jgi:hypothetical protein